MNEHFYKDQIGIYSKDGKILYFAFNENTRQYVVRDGFLQGEKIGSLVEPISKSKPILYPKLKTVVAPEAMIRDNIIDRCITGPNLSNPKNN